MIKKVRILISLVFVLCFSSMFLFDNVVLGETVDYNSLSDIKNDNDDYDVISYDRNGNEYFYSYDDFLYDNCAGFTIDVWNAAMPQYSFNEPAIPTPHNLRTQINSLSGHTINEPVLGGSNVGYYSGSNFIYSIS